MKSRSEMSRTVLGGVLTLLLGFIFVGEATAQIGTPPPARLVAWWPGDRTAVDMQGTNDGVLFGSATFAPGQVGQAFRFDGVDDFVDSQNQVGITGTGARSIEFWVNIPDDASSEFGYIPVGYGAASTDVHSRVRDRVAVALST